MPLESTFWRTLQGLDADAFDELAGRWAVQLTAPGPGGRRVIAAAVITADAMHAQTSGTAWMLARLTGWPPPELLVTVSVTSGTAEACSASSRWSAATSMFPLKGCRSAGWRPSGMGRSTACTPVNSILARVPDSPVWVRQ